MPPRKKPTRKSPRGSAKGDVPLAHYKKEDLVLVHWKKIKWPAKITQHLGSEIIVTWFYDTAQT